MGHWGFGSILKALPPAHNLSRPALTELLPISHLTISSPPQVSLQNLVLAHFCFAQPEKRASLELRKNMQLSSDYSHYRNPMVTNSAHIQRKFQEDCSFCPLLCQQMGTGPQPSTITDVAQSISRDCCLALQQGRAEAPSFLLPKAIRTPHQAIFPSCSFLTPETLGTYQGTALPAATANWFKILLALSPMSVKLPKTRHVTFNFDQMRSLFISNLENKKHLMQLRESFSFLLAS
uniref:Uncharacterized protein n=1 Tax=Phasianus colchicus TaxID=9054 RepID=A0A669QE24_PHACC